MDDPSLFVAGTTPGRAVLLQDLQFMAVKLDFLGESTVITLGKREHCIRGGCSARGSFFLEQATMKLFLRDET
jgi:hypothetical protein